MWEYLDANSTMALHDWGRSHYHRLVLGLYDEVEVPYKLRQLAFFRRKQGDITVHDVELYTDEERLEMKMEYPNTLILFTLFVMTDLDDDDDDDAALP